MPDHVGIDEITHAYIKGVITDKPLNQPVFSAVANIAGRWLRINYTVTHEWLDELPPEIAKLLPTEGPTQ